MTRMTVKGGVTAPAAAAIAPGTPATFMPMYTAELIAMMPGTVCVSAVMSSSSSRVRSLRLTTNISSMTGSMARPPPTTSAVMRKKEQ